MPKIALYLRLSVDEFGTDESNSITNQRYLLTHYLKHSIEFRNLEYLEFVDDGFSGTTLNRPAFQRLMSNVKLGAIKVIIVKDFSRFMRDYLELGNYLENIFPFLGVRFIALNDQYDSKISEQNGLEIDVPFRNLLNDFYSKDVSEKVKSAMNTMKRSGKNMSWLPPFGYIKNPEDRFSIIIDEEVVSIVRQIFRLCIEGMGTQHIASLLNEEKTITPAERKMQVSQAKYQKSIILTDEQKRNIWTKTSVRQILKNEAYKGTYLFNTRTYIKGKHIKRPKSEWERIEHNHESIVSAEVFEQAQQALKSRVTAKKRQKPSHQSRQVLLRGLVFCEHCGHRLLLRRNHSRYCYFYCRYCKSQGSRITFCRSDKIEQEIVETLASQLDVIQPKQSKASILRELERLKLQKLSYFEDYKENNLSREDYISRKHLIDKEIVDLGASMIEGNKLPLTTDKGVTKELLETYVDKVIVDCLGFFKVVYK